MKYSRQIACFAVAAAVSAGCGSQSGFQAARSPSVTANPTAMSEAVPTALQFTAKTLDGHDFSGASLLGKPAVLWFWAPWCPVCQGEAPAVGQIAATHPAVTFVGVGGLDHMPAIQQFANKYPVDGFTQLADTDGAVWAKFGVTHQPAYAFIRADGGIDVVKQPLSDPELSQRVTELANP